MGFNKVLILKNFLPDECIKEGLSISRTEENWKLEGNVPCRLTTKIDKYPLVKEFLCEKFGKENFFIEDRIYFSKYEPGAICKKHQDPSSYTIIMLLQQATLGGNLMLGSNKAKIAKLYKGDAVIFEGSTDHFITEVVEGTRIALTLWLSDIPEEYKIKLK